MSKKIVRASNQDVNGKAGDDFRAGTEAPEPPVTPRDMALLKEAVDNPGSATIPEATSGGATPIPAIPAYDLNPDEETGEVLALDPRLLTAKIGRPSPDVWHQLHLSRSLRVLLLAHKPRADAGSEFYYVVPELQPAVARGLKAVHAHLLSPLGAGGEALLWLVLESAYSPYHAAVNRILAQGADFVAKHKFRILPPGGRDKVCEIRFAPLTAEDPAPVVPSRPVGELLYSAMAADQRLISDPSHPVFHTLTTGRSL
jgi:hypothetical protein